ncbi:MAG TPA: hypothetical protein VMS64_00170 [Candidatus Methylomirabilis sp.]|nr:hypothetical protein [Candidatus Methylomirabilis sp.]
MKKPTNRCSKKAAGARVIKDLRPRKDRTVRGGLVQQLAQIIKIAGDEVGIGGKNMN